MSTSEGKEKNTEEKQKSRSLFTALVDLTYDAVRPTSMPNSGPVREKQDSSASPDDEIRTMSSAAQRHVKWEYAVPIVATPLAHICVSLIRKYPQHKRKLYWGVGIATFLTLQARIILMYDAGYPGQEKPNREGLPAFVKFLLF